MNSRLFVSARGAGLYIISEITIGVLRLQAAKGSTGRDKPEAPERAPKQANHPRNGQTSFERKVVSGSTQKRETKRICTFKDRDKD